MSVGRLLTTSRLLVLAGVLGALALVVGLTLGMPSQAEAHIPHDGLNFTIDAVGEDCDSSEGDAVCFIDPDTTFTLAISLEDLPSDIVSYEAFDLVVDYTGLTSADDADIVWPDCGFPAQFFTPGRVAVGCTVGLPPATASSYTGILATNSFTCDESGTIALRNGDGLTNLLETVGIAHAEGADETLNITCGDEPTATNTAVPATATPLPGLAGVGTGGAIDGGSQSTWTLVAMLLAVAAAGAGLLGWRLAVARER